MPQVFIICGYKLKYKLTYSNVSRLISLIVVQDDLLR